MLVARRAATLFVLLIASIAAIQPAVHSHPLVPEQTDGCSIAAAPAPFCGSCATIVAPMTLERPELQAPLTHEAFFTPIPASLPTPERRGPTSPRAPPAA